MFALQTLSLLLPIALPGIVLIIALKKNWLAWLDTPIDHNKQLANKPIFGRNKTYRGIVLYIVGSVLVCTTLFILQQAGSPWIHWLFTYNPLVLGVVFGASYALGELLNSFVKRQLGIAPGTVSKRYGGLQRLIDLSDGPIMATIVLVLIYGFSPQSPLALIAGIGLHYIAEYVMKRTRLK